MTDEASEVKSTALNPPPKIKPIRLPLFLAKFTRFEYFPVWLVYLPIVPYILWLMLKARSLVYFTSANPNIDMGGFFGESKIDILRKINKKFLPVTLFFKKNTAFELVKNVLPNNNLSFPMIVKPNVGERGNLVEKVENEEGLRIHIEKINADFIVQEYIDFPVEMGILFHRFPDKNAGKITSITIKDFLKVIGDGKSNIEEILEVDLRSRFQLQRFRQIQPEMLKIVLGKGEILMPEPIGNHCRGTKFLSGNHLINEKLEQIFSEIALEIEGFYYGRFDIRVKSIEDLYEGKNIKIMELNGISSDPAHIFDPELPIFRAYGDLFKHLKIIYQISLANKKRGIPYAPLGDCIKKVYRYFWLKKTETSSN